MNNGRRAFIKKAALSTAAITIGGTLPGFSARSYRHIIGANERIRVGIMGVNSRGLALAENFSMQSNCSVIYISDVDVRAAEKLFSMNMNITGIMYVIIFIPG